MTRQSHETLWLHANSRGLSRRKFLLLISEGGAAAVLAACDKTEVRSDESKEVVIVGSGPVGTAAAIRLAEQGIKVLVLESGSSIIEPAGSHFRNQEKFEQDPDGYFAGIGPFLQPFTSDDSSVLPGLADTQLHGGQGVIWTNNCPRAAEFERWGSLTTREWEDRYREAESALQVINNLSTTSQTAQNIRAQLEGKLAADRSIRELPISGSLKTNGEVYFNAPWDYLQAASQEVRDRIEIRSGIAVNRLLHGDGRVSAIETMNASGKLETIEVQALLIAGGAVGTPRLLHNSNLHQDVLGRGFSFHSLLFGQIVLEESIAAGPDSGDVAPHLWIPPTADKPWHIQVLRDTYPVPTDQVVDNSHRLLEFQAFLPVVFRDENQLLFKEDGNVQVQFEFSEQDREMMQRVEEDVRSIAAELGLWRGGGGEPAWVPPGTAHLVGTCRMDLPDWKGVADSHGCVHGMDNLYLASVGLIPRAVAVNPTLTATALALKTADFLASKL